MNFIEGSGNRHSCCVHYDDCLSAFAKTNGSYGHCPRQCADYQRDDRIGPLLLAEYFTRRSKQIGDVHFDDESCSSCGFTGSPAEFVRGRNRDGSVRLLSRCLECERARERQKRRLRVPSSAG